jgi:hypothetical protein
MGTTLKEQVPGWYIQFQAALLQSAPRPGEISKETAVAWSNGQAALKQQLAGLTEYRADVVGLPYRAGNVDNLVMNHEGALSPPEPKWREENNIIYFSVTSDGTTGRAWIKRLEQKGFRLSPEIKELLCSRRFKGTNGVTTEVAVMKGALFLRHNRTFKIICSSAHGRKWNKLNSEIACLIREKFSDGEIRDMGLLAIFAAYDPDTDSFGDSSFLVSIRYFTSVEFNVSSVRSFGGIIDLNHGFAFAVSQSSSA